MAAAAGIGGAAAAESVVTYHGVVGQEAGALRVILLLSERDADKVRDLFPVGFRKEGARSRMAIKNILAMRRHWLSWSERAGCRSGFASMASSVRSFSA
jgi:hypothetical protein